MRETSEIQLSIITPTYNRAFCLRSCFDSLLRQTSKDFEWIVVDDGSTDDTEELVKSFSTDSFPLRYIKKENGGKHTALNAAHKLIRGNYVLILDSDDTLTDDAVSLILAAWQRWNAQKEVGIVTLLKGKDKEHPNCCAKDENIPVDIMSYNRTHYVSNDACEVIRTELFLKYPFPTFPGERFISEGALWNRVSFTHKCVYVNEVVYLCNYLENGLTKSGKQLRIRNPLGGMYTAELNMCKKNSCNRRWKNGMLYTCYGCFAKQSIAQMSINCGNRKLMYLCYPFGKLLYLYWKRKYRTELQ